MKLGFSQPWPQTLEAMTGSDRMSAGSFVKNFLPLYDFLEEENGKNGECIGWAGKYKIQAFYYSSGANEHPKTT